MSLFEAAKCGLVHCTVVLQLVVTGGLVHLMEVLGSSLIVVLRGVLLFLSRLVALCFVWNCLGLV